MEKLIIYVVFLKILLIIIIYKRCMYIIEYFCYCLDFYVMYCFEYGISVGIRLFDWGFYNFIFVDNYLSGDGKFMIWWGFFYYVLLERWWMDYY